MTSGFDPERMARAVALAEACDSPWPRSMYYDDGSYVGNVEWNETGPWTEIVGPVEPRGGPAGLVLRGGQEIARWGDAVRADMTFSIAKSYLATLAGVAHGDGLLPDLDEPVCARVPGPVFEGPHNGQIKWRHFLNMNSEWSGTLFGKSDQVDHYRQIGPGADNGRKGEKRLMQSPGSHYEYNDVRVNALSFALMSLFRRPLPEVLRDRIMDPIGASRGWRWEGYDSSWVEIDGRRMQSVPGGGHWGGGLFISAVDHARFGQLILRDGVHDGQRLLPGGWMAQAVTPSATLANYGFLWWLNRGPGANTALPANSFAAQGAGSHQIWIDPEHDVVAVLRWVAGDRAQEVLEAIVRAF